MSVKCEPIIEYDSFPTDRKPVLVIGYPRSGNHFLINAICDSFGYKEYIDLDFNHLPANYYDPRSILERLKILRENRVANVLKSHHSVDFFTGILDDVLAHYMVFYIVRDPRKVMRSYWQFMRSWQKSNEGPKCATVGEFMRAEPAGHMQRYQYVQYASILDQWAAHVNGWLSVKDQRLNVVEYENLDRSFQEQLDRLSYLFGMEPLTRTRPDRERSVMYCADYDGLGDWLDEDERWLLKRLKLPRFLLS